MLTSEAPITLSSLMRTFNNWAEAVVWRVQTKRKNRLIRKFIQQTYVSTLDASSDGFKSSLFSSTNDSLVPSAPFLTTITKHLRSRVFASTWLLYAGFYFCRKNFSVAMPLLKSDLGFTTDDLALILVFYNACYMLGQFGAGLLSARWGPKLVLSAGVFLIVSLNILMGFTGTHLVFLFIGAMHGFAQSTGWPATCQIMANWYRKEERGVVMAWWSTNYVLGGFLATLFATWCITSQTFFPALGWRRGFWAPATVLTIIGVIFMVFAKEAPENLESSSSESEPSKPSVASIEPDTTSRWYIFKPLLRNQALWIASAMYFFLKLTRYALLFWLPVYLTEALGYSTKDAGNASASYELFGIGGTLAAGYLSDKVFGSRRFAVSALMLFGLAGACLLQPSLASIGFTGMVVAVGLMGFMTYGPDSIMTGAAPMDMGDSRTSATAVGIINGMGSMGQLTSPLIVAWVSNHYGWPALFHFFVACSLIGGVLLLTQWNYGKSQPRLAIAV